jgi:hypothetical protein
MLQVFVLIPYSDDFHYIDMYAIAFFVLILVEVVVIFACTSAYLSILTKKLENGLTDFN